MKALISAAVELCLLRLGPQHLPASQALFALLMLFSLLLSMLMVIVGGGGLAVALLEGLFLVVWALGLLYLALKLTRRLRRFNQTGSAIFLTDLLLGLLSLPLASWYQRTGSTESGLLMLILLFWNVVVLGHILRHAFEVELNIGIAAALLYTLVTLNITAVVFPGGA